MKGNNILVIKCPNCGGPMWEEDLPDSDRSIDLACIICGLRRFYPKQKYKQWKAKVEKAYAHTTAAARRTLHT